MDDLEQGATTLQQVSRKDIEQVAGDSSRRATPQRSETEAGLPSKQDSWLRKAGLDERMLLAEPKHVPAHAREPLNKFLAQANSKTPKGLYLFGGVGTGKTMAAACVARQLVRIGLLQEDEYDSRFGPEDIRWWAYSDLMVRLQNPYERETWIKRCIGVRWLFLDDYGTAAASPEMDQWMDQIVDGRYRRMKPMIVTSNLTPEELGHANERLADRWVQTLVKVPFSGKSRR